MLTYPNINRVLSIKLLVVLLAATGISACLLMGGLLYYSNTSISHEQQQLVNTTEVQDVASEIELALIALISRQSEIFVARNRADLYALPNKSQPQQQFNQSLDKLKDIKNKKLRAAISNTEVAYSNFNEFDQQLLKSTSAIISTQPFLSIKTIRIKEQLEELSTQSDAINGKLNYAVKHLKRRIVRSIKNGLSLDSQKTNEQIVRYVTGDATKRLELSQRVRQQLLNFSSLVHEFNSINNIDVLVSIRSNQAKQLTDEINALLVEMEAVLIGDEVLKELTIKFGHDFSALAKSVFSARQSLFFLRKTYIEQRSIQHESIRLSKFAANDVTIELKKMIAEISMIRNRIVSRSTSEIIANTNLAIVIGCLTLVALLSMGLFTFYRTSKPLNRIANAMDGIAQGEGDLTKRLDTNAIHEVARIATGFNQFVEKAQSVERELDLAQKLESVGRLAAGVAHEINTPIQYVSDNTRFLDEAFKDLLELQKAQTTLLDAARKGSVEPDLITIIDEAIEEADIDYLMDEIPRAILQALEGTARISKIVGAMKQFSHPGSDTKKVVDINDSLESTLTVSSAEWKYVANVEKDFDPNLPSILCFPGELGQVFLNLIVNAAHAIADVVGDDEKQKGIIRLTTRHLDDNVEIRIGDTGPGIPESSHDKLFESFFTTKEVGRGTGQGLSIAHKVVVDQHSGSIDFETTVGVGTTFIIRLPIEQNGELPKQELAE